VTGNGNSGDERNRGDRSGQNCERGQVILNGGGKKGSISELWAGRSIEKIMAILVQAFGGGSDQKKVIQR
jgi:hypothetical protein